MKMDEVRKLRERILLMHKSAYSPTDIANTLGCSRKAVYKALQQGLADNRQANTGRPGYDDKVKTKILAARKKHHDAGGLLLHHLIKSRPAHYGFEQTDTIPSPTLIATYINQAGLANKPIGPKDTRTYPDAPPTVPGTLTIDTWGPWHIKADKIYLATIQDRFTRAVIVMPALTVKYPHNNQAGLGFSAAIWAKAVAAAHQYISPGAHTLYSDNGVGIVPALNYLPLSTRYILSLGMKLVFIPPAQPWRNGRLERFHGSMHREYWRAEQPETIEEGLGGLVEYLNFYNHHRPHSSIKCQPPVTSLPIKPFPQKYWNELQVPEKLAQQTGLIDAIRLVYNDGSVDLWGATLHVSPLLAGQFVRVHFNVTGKLSEGHVTYQAKKGEDNIVARFTHNLDRGNNYPLIEAVELTDYVIEHKSNQNLDEDQLAKQQSKILKRRSRLEKRRGNQND